MTQLLPPPRPGLRIGRLLFILFAVLLAFVTLFALLRAALFYSLYTWLFAHVTEFTGLDLWASRAVALLALGIACLFPWHILILPWIGEIKQKLALFLLVTFAALVGMEFVTRDVYFSRADGRALRYYAKTADGFRLSATPGTDPVFGVPYQPVTSEVVKEILVWKRRGGGIPNSSHFEGPFFDTASGQAAAWFARLPDGRIEIFSLPGFHPRYGMRLEPVTAPIVAEYQKQKADAQNEEAARRASEEARRLRQPLRPGRYLFTGPVRATIDGLRFTLTEIDLTGNKLIMQLGLENVGLDPANELYSWERKTQRYTRLGVIAGNGEVFGYTAIRVKEGAVTENDGSLAFPAVGKRGACVLEFAFRKIFQAPFSFVVNEQPVFSGINLRQARFESF